MKLDKSGSYHTGVLLLLKASLKISYLITKQKKPYTIGEELIKSFVPKATQIILKKNQSKIWRQFLFRITQSNVEDDIEAE